MATYLYHCRHCGDPLTGPADTSALCAMRGDGDSLPCEAIESTPDGRAAAFVAEHPDHDYEATRDTFRRAAATLSPFVSRALAGTLPPKEYAR